MSCFYMTEVKCSTEGHWVNTNRQHPCGQVSEDGKGLYYLHPDNTRHGWQNVPEEWLEPGRCPKEGRQH